MKKNRKIIISKIDNFWNTNLSFYVLFTIVIITAIIQILLFVFGVTSISGIKKGSDLEWVSWLYLILSVPSTLLSFTSEIYSIRIDKKFLIPSIISSLFSMITFVAGGMIWSSIAIVFILFLNLFRFQLINKKGENYLIKKKFLLIGILLIFGFMILGLLLINSSIEELIWWNPNTKDFIKYIDVICSSTTIIGILLIANKNKYAFLVFLFGDIIFIIAFSFMSQWLTAIQIIVFLWIDIVGFLGWHFKEKYPKEWNQKPINNS